MQDSTGLQVRIFDQRVESLAEAGDAGSGCGSGSTAAPGTRTAPTSATAASARSPRAPSRRRAWPTPTSSPPRRRLGDPRGSRASPTPRRPTGEGERKVELAIATERAAREAGGRVAAVETTVFVDERAAVALASSRGVSGAYEATYCYAYLSAIAEQETIARPASGSAWAAPGARPRAIGREAASARPCCSARRSPPRAPARWSSTRPSRRASPEFIGGVLCADAVQRGRSPFAERLGEAVGSAALTLADDGADPAGSQLGPFDGEGTPTGSTTLIRAGELSAYLHDSYTARREGGDVRSTANAARRAIARRRRCRPPT